MVSELSLPFIYFQETEKDLYIPCEIAISQYSMSRGVFRSLHGFIKPPSIPKGYGYEVQQNAKSTHRLDDLADPLRTRSAKDYKSIVDTIQNFFLDGTGESQPMMFTLEVNITIKEHLINSINKLVS